MAGTDVARFTHKSVPVIFEPTCTSYRLNMFRALLCPSSVARNYNVEYHIGRFVLGLLQAKARCALACSPDTTPA